MDELTPLREDADVSEILRRDLERFAQNAAVFDTSAGLATLSRRALLSDLARSWPWFALPLALTLGLGLMLASEPSAPSAPADAAVQRPAVDPIETSPRVEPPAAPAAPPAPELREREVAAPVPSELALPERGRAQDASAAFTTQDEIAHMARLRVVASRDPVAALRMVREGSRRFRGGLFGEEREAMRVLMLAELHQTRRARRLGARFLRRHPESAFAPRIRGLVTP
ncbi:MAG: hypothetical protein GXP55_13250 [Deltaproteobacteria bacterium]|nr:hypothetical protein [Deltaproteobacteria bacterium]